MHFYAHPELGPSAEAEPVLSEAGAGAPQVKSPWLGSPYRAAGGAVGASVSPSERRSVWSDEVWVAVNWVVPLGLTE